MKAIETVYKGYKFRSRLEARWAVFFDELGLTWEYEKEGYDLDELGRYLPDFWLPDLKTVLEVKSEGDYPNQLAEDKLLALANHLKARGLLVYGDPYMNIEKAEVQKEPYWHYYDGYDGGDVDYLFCLCPWCEKVGIEYDGRGARVCGWKTHYKSEKKALAAIRHLGHWRADDKCYTADHPKIKGAALKARQARFEYGENP